MQNEKNGLSSWIGVLAPIALVAIAGGLFLADQLGTSESTNIVDLLMRVERFYREDLAYKYASLEVSDKRLKDAADHIDLLYKNKVEPALNELENEVSPDVEELIFVFDALVYSAVAKTAQFFSAVNETLTLLESNRRLSRLLEEMGVSTNVGKILYTPMNQVIIDNYYNLLDNTVDSIKDKMRAGRFSQLGEKDQALLNKFVDSLNDVALFLGALYYYATELDKKCTEYLHTRCTWVLHDLVENEKVNVWPANISLILLFNDIAALIHRFADKLSEIKPLGKVQIGNIPIGFATNANPTLINAAKEWASTVTLLKNRGWPYAFHDLEPLRGTVVDDYAWLRVGSAKGHATHIRKEGGLFIVRYYDADMPVNRLFAGLVKKYIPDAKVTVLNDGVEIRVNSEGDLRRVAKLLAFTTSLDILIQRTGVATASDRIEDAIEDLKLVS